MLWLSVAFARLADTPRRRALADPTTRAFSRLRRIPILAIACDTPQPPFLLTAPQATHDAYTAEEHAERVTSVDVVGAGSRLSAWPPLLSTFSRVTTLRIHGHRMTALPFSVGAGMPALRSLAVTGGCLAAVPAELSELSALRDLDLHANELRLLPPSLCSLTGLTALNLMGNALTALPDAIGGLTALRRLGLKSNRLAALPDGFTRLGRLEELFLTDNLLETLPDGVSALTSLVKLQGSFNPWKRLPAGLLELPRLELLRVAVGGLEAWPALAAEEDKEEEQEDGVGRRRHPRLPPALAWCSIGGNPAAARLPAIPGSVRRVELADLAAGRGRLLGEGASGQCYIGGCICAFARAVGGGCNAMGWLVGHMPASKLPTLTTERGLSAHDTHPKQPLNTQRPQPQTTAELDGEPAALKLFLSEVSPDGRAQDEVAISCRASGHPSLTNVRALVYDARGDAWPDPDEGGYDAGEAAGGADADAGSGEAADSAAGGAADGSGGDGKPQQQQQQPKQHDHEAAKGLLLDLVDGAPLAAKPTSAHLLRCKWVPGTSFSPAEALAVAGDVAGALAHLHSRRVCHGDVYAHNVLFSPSSTSFPPSSSAGAGGAGGAGRAGEGAGGAGGGGRGAKAGARPRAVLCDFGASFCYGPGEEFWELMEVRAYGIFLADVAARVRTDDGDGGNGGGDGDGGASAGAAQQLARSLAALADRCSAIGAEGRPRFAEVAAELSGLRRMVE